MYRAYYAKKDTTLYERYPEQNTGIDQILELTKIASGSKLNGVFQNNTYNTRFILDFGSQITTLANAITSGEIPPLGNNTDSGCKGASSSTELRTIAGNDSEYFKGRWGEFCIWNNHCGDFDLL